MDIDVFELLICFTGRADASNFKPSLDEEPNALISVQVRRCSPKHTNCGDNFRLVLDAAVSVG